MKIYPSMIGTTRYNSVGEPYYIEQKLSKTKYIVEFLNTGTRLLAHQSSVSTGSIKDPYSPLVCGIGYKGEGYINESIYDIWFDLLRCVTGKTNDKYNKRLYKDILLDPRWCNFQNFQRWYLDNKYIKGFHVIDKDLSGSKTYGPDTCYVLPYFINSSIIYNKISNKKTLFGIASHGKGWYSELTTLLGEFKVFHTKDIYVFFTYKYMKEYYIKSLANISLLNGSINMRTYDALHKYQITVPNEVIKPNDIDEYITNLYKHNFTFQKFIRELRSNLQTKVNQIYAQRLSKASQK